MGATTVVLDDGTTTYTIYGSADAGNPSLARDGLQAPVPSMVLEYASPGRFVDGDAPVAGRRPNAVLGMRVRLTSATAETHQTNLEALTAIVSTFTFTATIKDGATTVSAWRACAGTVAPVSGTRIQIDGGTIREDFTIAIPVHPRRL